MNYKRLAKMFGYLMAGIREIMDAFCPDDDEKLADIVLELVAITDKAIEYCND